MRCQNRKLAESNLKHTFFFCIICKSLKITLLFIGCFENSSDCQDIKKKSHKLFFAAHFSRDSINPCVAYMQEGFLSIRFFLNLFLNLLNKCKKGFQLNLSPLTVFFFRLGIKFLIDRWVTRYLNSTFLGYYDSRLDFRLIK
jgi:hypothetical protein